jgi:uncharacterized peroxidase-related enzyme
MEEPLVKQLAEDYTKAEWPPAERAMLDYAAQLTRAPWAMARADVDTLRASGWSDAAILNMNIVASYFAFVNRIADGLGVELEDDWDSSVYPPKRIRLESKQRR